jgi:hypothetical protein
MAEQMSFVKAAILFFGDPPYGRKVHIPEFKELTMQDKIELSQMLNAVPGYEHVLYTGEKAA